MFVDTLRFINIGSYTVAYEVFCLLGLDINHFPYNKLLCMLTVSSIAYRLKVFTNRKNIIYSKVEQTCVYIFNFIIVNYLFNLYNLVVDTHKHPIFTRYSF